MRFEMPPLAWATMMGQTEAAKLLLQHGADVNGRNRDGNTALHLAIFLGHAGSAELLLKNGADVTARNDDGATPIDMLAVPWEMTKMLLEPLGIKLEQKLVEAGRAKIAEMLNVKSSNLSEGKSTLPGEEIWDAASAGNLSVVKQAIANGMDVNMKDPKSGGTLLATAALMGHTEIVALLLEHGADVNARSKDGGTALHAAAFLGRVETVKLLLDKGADTTLRHKMGGTAIDGAKLNWLLSKGILATLKIKVDAAEVKAGRAEVVKLLSRPKKK